MKKETIVIFGGTVEGRKLSEAFQGTELMVHICVATQYGASLLPAAPNMKVHIGRMEAEEMESFLKSEKADLVVDATHPYAGFVTENIRTVCGNLGLLLIRILREQEKVDHVFFVDSVDGAVELLKGTHGKILITTGSKELEKFTGMDEYENRCIARVLPVLSVMEKCSALGFTGKNLIAMQGPFSEEMNYSMLRQTGCTWLVTKESGKEGGYMEKYEAAMRARAKLVVIRRPEESGRTADLPEGGETAVEAEDIEHFRGMTYSEALDYLSRKYGIERKRTVYLIGAGPGSEEILTGEAVKCLQESECVIGAKRMLEVSRQAVGEKPCFQAYKAEEIAAFLREHREYGTVSLIYSGDVGFYSGADSIWKVLRDFQLIAVSGISMVQYFLNKIGESWQDVECISLHGRQAYLIPALLKKGKVFALMGSGKEAAQIGACLLEFGMNRVKIVVGERLSYPEERIVSGTPEEIAALVFEPLSVMYLKLEELSVCDAVITPGIPDSAFLRKRQSRKAEAAAMGETMISAAGTVPMTKQGIRILSLAKLELTENAIVYDIGAGTGSVSIEAARLCGKGTIYAIEKDGGAAELIRANRVRFRAENLTVVEGCAPEILEALPAPTHVFIGGSSGNLIELVRAVYRKNPAARFVVNAVTLETMALIGQIPKVFPEYSDMEIIQVNIASGKSAGRYHLMCAENPITIASFGGKAWETGWKTV